eukprot:scaffold5064_cov121-Cylindrotheca_fusiformis.AAC.15
MDIHTNKDLLFGKMDLYDATRCLKEHCPAYCLAKLLAALLVFGQLARTAEVLLIPGFSIHWDQ